MTLSLDPSIAGSAHRLARHFANEWANQHDRHGRWASAQSDRIVLARFFDVMARKGISEWADITVDVLRATEAIFDDSHYYPTAVWRTLRRLHPGVLTDDVETFIKSPPQVSKPFLQATEAMPSAMLRDVLRQAMRDVTKAEARVRSIDWDGCSLPPKDALVRRHETTAFYILLCMEWSQSPDVVAELSFDPAQPTSVQDWHDGEPKVTVQWYKNRGGGNGVTLMLADKAWRSGSILRRLRQVTEPTRFRAGAEWADAPWLYARPVDASGYSRMSDSTKSRVLDWNGSTGLLVESIHRPGGNQRGLRAWCEHLRDDGRSVAVDPIYQGEGANLPYRAIRPAAKWARFVATGGGLLLSELVDDNTIEVLSAHYLNSEVAMRDIGEAWAQVPNLAEEVARGLRPTLVDHGGEVIAGRGLGEGERSQALGDNRVGVSGCRDPKQSPLNGEKSGSLCTQANRSCYACPNSVVSPDDIPSLKAYLLLAERAHGHLSPPEWQMHWGLTVRWICYALPLLDPNWEKLPIGNADLFDLGMEAGPA